jgi:chromosomal replication initiation ATPase DnaA
MASRPARQLALDLPHAESFAREDFVGHPTNRVALTAVERWPDWPTRMLALVGAAGTGKSHLASIWAGRAGARSVAGQALTHAAVPDALATGALVLEDAGLADELALFHLLNLAREEGAFLLLTSRTLPAGLPTGLPDLASRLKAIPVVRLDQPDDDLLRAVLFKLFADRQVEPDDDLVGFVISRIDRSLGAARNAVRLIDAEALRRRRPVTRSLAAEVLRSGSLSGNDLSAGEGGPHMSRSGNETGGN